MVDDLKQKILANLNDEKSSKFYKTMRDFENFNQHYHDNIETILKTWGNIDIYRNTMHESPSPIATFDLELFDRLYEEGKDPYDAHFTDVSLPFDFLKKMGFKEGDQIPYLTIFFEYFKKKTGIYVARFNVNVSKKEIKQIVEGDYSIFEKKADKRAVIE